MNLEQLVFLRVIVVVLMIGSLATGLSCGVLIVEHVAHKSHEHFLRIASVVFVISTASLYFLLGVKL